MILKELEDSKFVLKSERARVSFLKSGDMYAADFGAVMVNQVLSNEVDGALNNLYLRVFKDDGSIVSAPMLGVKSGSVFAVGEKQVKWTGAFAGVSYEVVFALTDADCWFWDVKLSGNGETVDVMYGQDLGLANIGALQANEAYVAQYVDHRVFEDDATGYVVCSRQNQEQGSGVFPYLQQGSLTRNVGFATDGTQFFGLSYKATDEPEVLTQDGLPNEVYQYEFAYTALQADRVSLTAGVTEQVVFYALFKESHADAVRELEYQDAVRAAWDAVVVEDAFVTVDKVAKREDIGSVLQTVDVTRAELDADYPERFQEEWDGDRLLSFFTETHEHVVLRAKDLELERSHGHILFSGNQLTVDVPVLTTTAYMYGVFNAQVVIGNTSMNKMLTNVRNFLNVLKTSGQRIYVKVADRYQLLGMPSLFEMGFNYAKWVYKTPTETFVVTVFTTVDGVDMTLQVCSASGAEYAYLVTNQVIVNENEYRASFGAEQDGNLLRFTVDAAGVPANVCPDLTYFMHVTGAAMRVTDASRLVTNVPNGAGSLVVLELGATKNFEIRMQGNLDGSDFVNRVQELDAEREKYRAHFAEVMHGFELSQNGLQTSKLRKVNALTWWYTHNMFVHYLVPHGLEQYGGAAWGTRDVCQGPMEYFMAMQRYDIVKQILTRVFSHQFDDDGNWPQWFMFDGYANIQAAESHGDVIVWPLKAVSDYLLATRDYAILDVEVPYMSRANFTYTDYSETIYQHLKKEIGYITDHFLFETHLSCYGDGDWDDTLQPHDAQLKSNMASSWTVALTYQAMKQFAQAIETIDPEKASELDALVAGIEADFNKYMLSTDIIPGFVYMENPEHVELMIHPTDRKTGIQYRLLPMTRSMIGELLTPDQAESHFQLIKRELQCPDGVRLMNRPATYQGGVSTNFKRAEQAANFGREVGLQYVHAHIRFREAMAKLGKKEEAWHALDVINPINIKDVVLNAARRQSNAYFSSSDGKFKTRYEAQEQFDKLKTGDVTVKGGWRIYSSGPGIYLNQLIANVLGVRVVGEDLLLDPVLVDNLDGLEFSFSYAGRPVKFCYHLADNARRYVLVNGEEVPSVRSQNRYREGGMLLSKRDLEAVLHTDNNIVEIYF
ncbi:cellobiose phosphorylase [Listeria sp. W9-0585]|uniref:Cellobiose phosphorylase n=2 Tax=Listeria rustica TaxID=2713503 RepID=A0A7W1YG99_9LIST|nr:amylo-alpha-1,6-glucosidase [Listeria rustica]MBA3926447.1 cellobiose phosphorylase [Listeria rustica]